MRDLFEINSHPKKQLDKKRAAMYVRMSTDLQKYSTENQMAAIKTLIRDKELIV